MKANNDGVFLMNVVDWASAVQTAVKQYHSADIHLRIGEQDSIICNIYNWSAQTLACSLYVWLTEDSIVSAQYFPEGPTKNYLRNTTLSAEDIAYLLGYQDLNLFYRAFSLWTGKSISEYKAKLADNEG